MSRLFLTMFAFSLAAACSSRNERLAMIDTPIEASSVAQLEAKSRDFAERHDLALVDQIHRNEGYLTLRNRDLSIQTAIDQGRLQIVVSGPPTPEAAELGRRYINEVVPGGPHIGEPRRSED